MRLVARVARAEMRRQLASPPPRPPAFANTLLEFPNFGANPGRLRMMLYVPRAQVVAPGAPLVLLLHGCGQDAATFAFDSGWTDLADEMGLPLVIPEQSEANNQGRCFQWFHTSQTMRGEGEVHSIAEMARAAAARFGSAADRIFVVGLSAGGAMAAALLVAYPDLFAAGAVVAGLPVGVAGTASQALARMSNPGPDRSPSDWAALARKTAPAGFNGAWPRLSIWHGEEDDVVASKNGAHLAAQWRGLQGLPDAPSRDVATTHGARQRIWGPAAAPALEYWTIAGIRHAYPVGKGSGRRARFMADCGVPATRMIARFWGI
ncbi:MAG: PHB depolymerase family esterase [Acetobacteraceae bacterium]|nr:PHB depolymerase family esterase [Acetobacteraceae bacterium]